jgi:hypothetical protein
VASDTSSSDFSSQRPAENMGFKLIYIIWSAFVLLYLFFESRDEHALKEADHRLICQVLDEFGNFKQPWKLYDTVYSVHAAVMLCRYILMPSLIVKSARRNTSNTAFDYTRIQATRGQALSPIVLHDCSHFFTFLFLMLFAIFRASFSQIDLISDPRCED